MSPMSSKRMSIRMHANINNINVSHRRFWLNIQINITSSKESPDFCTDAFTAGNFK